MAADLTDAQVEQLLAACGLVPPPKYRGGRPRLPIAHGTTAGARTHQRRGEAACGPCARAMRQYQRQRYARLTARQPTTEGAP